MGGGLASVAEIITTVGSTGQVCFHFCVRAAKDEEHTAMIKIGPLSRV